MLGFLISVAIYEKKQQNKIRVGLKVWILTLEKRSLFEEQNR